MELDSHMPDCGDGKFTHNFVEKAWLFKIHVNSVLHLYTTEYHDLVTFESLRRVYPYFVLGFRCPSSPVYESIAYGSLTFLGEFTILALY